MIKYADKKAAVVISSVFMDELRIRMKNKVKVGAEHQDDLARDPFQIGMKNVRKLMEGMRGAVLVETDGTDAGKSLYGTDYGLYEQDAGYCL